MYLMIGKQKTSETIQFNNAGTRAGSDIGLETGAQGLSWLRPYETIQLYG